MIAISHKIGRAIKTRREELGLSQEKLAERSKLHRTYISDVERGTRNITIVSLSRLLSALNLSLEEFFSEYYKE
jgi:transcriptional regulator with XRE-family HTH domain